MVAAQGVRFIVSGVSLVCFATGTAIKKKRNEEDDVASTRIVEKHELRVKSRS